MEGKIKYTFDDKDYLVMKRIKPKLKRKKHPNEITDKKNNDISDYQSGEIWYVQIAREKEEET